MFENRHYDSKAILGAAHGYEFPEQGPLKPSEFSGGDVTVRPKLESLGFHVAVSPAALDSPFTPPPVWVEKIRVKGRADRLEGEFALGRALWSPAKSKSGSAESLQDALDFGEPRRGPGAGGDGDLNKAARQVARRLRGLAAGVDGAGGREPLLPILDARLRAGVLELHHLLRALEIEVAACAAALGADPLDPALQAIADRCRARLRALPDLPGLDPPIALTEPSDDDVAAFAARCRPEEGSDDAAW